MKLLLPSCAAVLTQIAALHAQPLTPSIRHDWSNVAMGGAGFVSGVFAHPTQEGLFYARTDVGGIYRLNPANDSWVPLLDWLPPTQGSHMGVEALALDPRNPAFIHLLAGTPYWRGGTGILSSADFGHTWRTTDVSKQIRAHGNKWGRHTGERLAVDPNSPNILFCGSRDTGLWKSTDTGKIWNSVASFTPGEPIPPKDEKQEPAHPASTANGNGICFVIIDPKSASPGQASRVLYLGLSRPRIETRNDAKVRTPDGNIYQSINGGETWRTLPALPDVGVPGSMANDSWHPNRAVLAGRRLIVTYQAENKPGGGVFRYDPKAEQWADITPGSISNKAPTQGQFIRTYNPYCGIDLIDTEPRRMLISTMGTYWPQKTLEGKTLWGERIYYSPQGGDEDGKTWIDIFGQDKGHTHSDIPFGRGQNIHWGAAVALDPFDANRAWNLVRQRSPENPNTRKGNPLDMEVPRRRHRRIRAHGHRQHPRRTARICNLGLRRIHQRRSRAILRVRPVPRGRRPQCAPRLRRQRSVRTDHSFELFRRNGPLRRLRQDLGENRTERPGQGRHRGAARALQRWTRHPLHTRRQKGLSKR
jgi:hypothetical protein